MKHLGIFISILCFFQAVYAQSRISAIGVEGNRKIETSAILEKISFEKGDQLDRDKVRDDIQKLFDMGFFEDIRVELDNGRLIYYVKEKPAVAAIEFEGNSELDADELNEKIAMKSYELVNYNKIQKAISEIQKAYEEKGYLLAQVEYKLEPMPDDQQGVKLVFNISENDKVKVKRISFIGNQYVDASELKGFMMTQEGGYFSFVSGSGTYKQDIFDDDIKRLSLVYLNKGYVQAKINRPEVSVTPDKKGIYIAIRITEGERFKIGEIDFAGDLMFEKSELKETVKIDEQEYFSYEVMQGDLRALEAKYGDLGYAYANPIPRTQILEDERKVNILFEIDKGEKVYFRKINIIGNTSTRDKVIRRELRIGEGELYNETNKRESEQNVQRLGYFDEVQFLTKTPSGRDDLMDIDIMVKERHTGAFQLGAGYADSLGAQLNVQLNESNFLGYGYRAGLRLEYNERYQNYLINFTDPYFRDSLWTVGGSLNYTDSDINDYIQESKGGTLTIGHPIYSRYLYGFLQYKISDDFVRFPQRFNPSDVFDVNKVNGLTSSLSAIIEYDKRNDRLMPSDGVYGRLSYEYAGLGGDIQFYKAEANVRYYQKLFWDVVFRNNLAYGVLGAMGGKPEPFTEYFRLGGPNNLRGYGFRRVGTRIRSQAYYDYLTAAPPAGEGIQPTQAEREAHVMVGGRQQAFYMAELEFPLAQEAAMRGVIFYDIGIASDELAASRLQADFGFGIRWFSPMGPLRFEFGFPLDRNEQFGDKSNNFQFAVGSPF